MTNNIHIIESQLRFTSPGDFYLIQVIKRRKDNPTLTCDMRLIDSWFIYSSEEFTQKLPRIIEQCETNNARAYIRLNKRNDKTVALQTLRLISASIACEQYKIKNCYLSACGQYHSDDKKTWVIDVDYPETEQVGEIESFIRELYVESKRESPILYCLPTKSGIHIICSPFNSHAFKMKYPTISIHKDNPTILYENCL